MHSEPIDADGWLDRLAQLERLGLSNLTPLEVEGLPEHFAVLARGERAGAEVLVGFSPTRGGDAALAVMGEGLRQSRAVAELLAISPCWSGADRRRLALVGDLPAPLLPIEVSDLVEPGETVRPEPTELGVPLTTEQVAARVRPGDRDLFRRGIAGLEGLAAKHGGTVRAHAGGIELVILAQRAALLAVSGSRMRLETPAPDRAQIELGSEGLSTALDRLEGSLRKRLNDRRSRAGEEGLRAGLVTVLGRAVDAVVTRPWPVQTHPEREIIDLVGADEQGRCFVAAARETLDLPALGEVLDATLALRPLLPLLLGPDFAVSADPPSLLLAAEHFDELAESALSSLRCESRLFDVGSRRSGGHTLEVRAAWVRPSQERAEAVVESEAAASASEARSEREPREAAEPEVVAPEREEATAAPAEGEVGGIEEISLFDLDDEGRGDDSDATGRRRRRGRRRGRRGRGRAGAGAERADDSEAGRAEASAEDDRPPPGEELAGEPDEDLDEDDGLVIADDDDDETFSPLAKDVPDLDEAEVVPDYEEDDEEEEDDEDGAAEEEREEEAARRERELRRRARRAKPPEPEPARPVRRRAAFVACADRPSILAALVLARDLRLVEGFWIYPQSELMTFFRSIATDLREDTPIHVVGFTASPPARDTIQAAALYRGRLDWYDQHDWPPEDLLALREALGEDRVHISEGAESALAAVLALRTRRSRFSDKLVELATGRFSQHDYERWGRLWWHRLGELAGRPGERRADIDPLLVGRPSELARRAVSVPVPDPPPEVAYVAGRDFRLVHFGGFVMVVLDVPPELDLHLASRVARERYEATLSLAHRPGGELLVLGGDEGPARRGLDLGAMTTHLASKLDWVEALADDDHVARVRVRGLWSVEGRMDEVVAEIAMGRSIVEG